jgi:hypothetical protein
MVTSEVRRTLLKTIGYALVVLPLASPSRDALATANQAVRGQVEYQDTPKDDKQCLGCLEFVPGKTEQDLGGCKKIPGDDEISPHGYCKLWNTM